MPLSRASSPPPIVLVVEDEPIQRMMAIDIVETGGFEAIAATDAAQAIRILETRPDIRLVFTDIDMPRGIDGTKLAALIRDRWPPIHVIVTSGQFSRDQIQLPEDAVFFPKPYAPAKIIAAMKRMAMAA